MARKFPPRSHDADPLRYLKQRGEHWHYVRRVPSHATLVDDRKLIQVALKTQSLEVAKLRRDAQEKADDLYWQSLAAGEPMAKAVASYEAAKARLRVLGFEYRTAVDIADRSSVEEIMRRLEMASISSISRDQAAIMGAVDTPRRSVSDAMKFYLDTIAIGETKGMSEKQIRKRNEQKTFAAETFAAVVGDRVLTEISREDAKQYYEHWMARVLGKDGEKPISGNTANRAYGNLRKLFREYAAHEGLDLKNPFDGFTFPDRKSQKKKIPPFEIEFLRDKILAVGAHEGLNDEALAIMLVLVETGCRPSEICNLPPENIHLSAKVPYITVDFQDERVIKTDSSVRDIPLVGVALAVMKRFPNGFPRYRDREDTLSATLMKHLRSKKLLPTPRHRVYSFRHSYEKRMLEGGLDYEFRKAMLGHSVDREKYGDGGAMAWRRDQLLKIALPFDERIVP